VSSTTVPRFARNRVHPFLSFALLQSFRALPAGSVRSRLPSLGFLSPSRRQLAESTHASIPSSLRSALGVSHSHDGLLLCWPCGFVSPRSHVRDFPSGVFPPTQPTISSMALALLPLASHAASACAEAPRYAAPSSGLCSAPESVATRRGLARDPLDPLLGFASSRFAPRTASAFASAPLMTLSQARSRSCPRSVFSVLRARGLTRVSRSQSTCPRFSA
jgi:hypothetical protein